MCKTLAPYGEAWSWQKSIVERRHIFMERDEDHLDILILLQNPPVYTLGTGSSDEYMKFDLNDAPYDVYRAERGGEVTYHGPGLLVVYPIINLRYHKMDLHWYLRSLEGVVIRALSSTFSIKASRMEGLTGVWFDLTPFQHIVACGLRDRKVGSISGLLGECSYGKSTNDAGYDSACHPMDMTQESLLKEFSEVFQLCLQRKPITDM